MINSRNRVFRAIVKVIKKRFKPVHILFIALLLTSNSFAWFIYMNKIDSDINVRVKAWNVSFRFDNETMTDYINFSVDEIYPGMDDFEQVLSVTNDGDVAAKLSYEIICIDRDCKYNSEISPLDLSKKLSLLFCFQESDLQSDRG